VQAQAGVADVTDDLADTDVIHFVYYRANKNDCSICSLKPKRTTALNRIAQSARGSAGATRT
jgi:hypothetical protein